MAQWRLIHDFMRDSDSCTLFLSAFPQPSHHSESPSLVSFFIVFTTNQFILIIYSFTIRFYILSVLFISSPRIHAFCSPILTYPTSFPHPAPDTPPSVPLQFMPMVADRPGGTEAGAGLHSQYPRRPPTLHPPTPGLRKRATELQGSTSRWRLLGASCHAGPACTAPAPLLRGPRVRRCGPGERADPERDVQLEWSWEMCAIKDVRPKRAGGAAGGCAWGPEWVREPRENMRGRGRLAERRGAPPWDKPGAKGNRSLVVCEHGKALRPSGAGLGAAVKGGNCGCVEVCAALWRMLRIGNRSGARGGRPHQPPSTWRPQGLVQWGNGCRDFFSEWGRGLHLWGPEEGSGLGIPTFPFEWGLRENNGSRYVAYGRELRVQKGLLAGWRELLLWPFWEPHFLAPLHRPLLLNSFAGSYSLYLVINYMSFYTREYSCLPAAQSP